MKKIISLFQRNYDGDRLVRDEIVPGAEWALRGEGVATRKFDGTCAMIRGGVLYKRYDLKASKGRHTPPDRWEPAQPEPDPVTTSWPGWVQVDASNPSDCYFIEALSGSEPDGTYELCGPKVNGNPEGLEKHTLVRHGEEELTVPLSFDGIRTYLSENYIEGIVWHHPDGRMVKIKTKDFGLKRENNKEST